MIARKVLGWLGVALLCGFSAAAADNVIISEFLTKNQSGIVDEDGSKEDWIEIFNAGTNTVDLLNWCLTDSPSSLAKWKFPSTVLAPGRTVLVWASGKNRRASGSPLHTSFKLDPSQGEYLGLVRPDLSIASQFAPGYPAQAQDVSYGYPVVGITNVLVAARAPARFLVPPDFSQDLAWTDPAYDTSSWLVATTGIGFNFATNLAATDVRAQMSNVNSSVYLRVPFNVADASIVSSLFLKMRYNDGFVAYLNGHEVARKNAPSAAAGGEVANSTNDWSASGAQGINGWYYGYYNRSTDTADNTYTFATDFNMDNDLWRFSTRWTLGLDDPPYTMIDRSTWMPNGGNNFEVHWPVRRWISPVSGVVTAQVTFAKAPGNTSGSGATLRVMLNGEVLTTRAIAAADTTGFTTNMLIRGLDVGDVLDFALDPTGTDAQNADTGDLCTFVAVINQAAASDPGWNSAATGPATAAQASVGETTDLSAYLSFLQSGLNVLAIHGLSQGPNDSDFLVLPELSGVVSIVNTTQAVYFLTPTPGALNGLGTTNLGPLITDVAHLPSEPLSNDVVTVTARATQTVNPISGLTLRYRVMFNAEVSVNMFDDGSHGDGAANDGIFGAAIPAGVAKPGEMIRYYVVSRDTLGSTNRSPSFLSLTTSPQYWGMVVKDPGITSSLPVLHWFLTNTAAAATEAGTRCSVYYNGQFLDNIGVTLHGQSSAGFPKKSYNFNLNSGYKLTVNPDYPALSDFAVLSTWADRSHMRIPLNTENYKMAGVPAHYAFILRMQQNGTFFDVANFTEQGNDKFLERVGLDPDGSLYKMYNTFTGAAGNEKKTRKYESTFDLQALYNAITTGDNNSRLAYLYDNVNMPEVINFLAAKAVSSDHDCCHKNYYFYRDSNGSGEWYALPWDFDLSFGHVWTSGNGNYFDDSVYTNLFLTVGDNNTLFALIKNDPVMRTMWMRRTRSLADQVLQPPGTIASNDFFRARIDYYAGLVRPDATLDKVKWGGASWTPPVGGVGPANATTTNPTNNFENELVRMKDYYLPGRRTFINLSTTASTYGLPGSQPSNSVILFGAIDYSPASSNQFQEFVELINTNNYAVDVSGWKIKGGIDFTLAPGTIITATNRIYVSRDVKAFRSRTAGPRAGQKLMVVGPFQGQLSARGETLALVNAAGQTNSSLTYAGAPGSAQQYLRITEIMYNPAAPAAGPYTRDDFEYIEFKNISASVTLNLNGVKLVDGIAFDFAGSAITSLAPGQRCLVVRNSAAFASRYGAGLPIAGAFAGSLDDGGESIRLLDAVNEEILDFAYNNSWYPITDGLGFSLVVVNEQAEPDAWDTKANWRASGAVRGSPAVDDPAPIAVAPIRVNEVLAHTILPQIDAVELFNPTTNDVNVGGWFITDNFQLPMKYRIPAGTIISAGGYLVFDESQFAPAGVGFGFSAVGEEAYLFSGDASTNLTGYFHGFEFGAADPGVSFAPYVNSQTNTYIVAQKSTTFGAANAGPRVGPVVVSEIMYAPVDSSDFEYIELLNLSSNAVPLYDPAYPTNRWKLKDAVSFTFSTNTILAPGAYLVVVSFNPQTNAAALSAFRTRYSLDPSVVIVGPYQGQLDNNGDHVELASPQAPDTNGWDYVLVDKVDYDPTLPWDVAGSGIGASLHRLVAGAFGNDPTNWLAALPSPGRPRLGNTLPTIDVPPQGGLYVENSAITLTVSASGEGPLGYQWRFNGAPISGAIGASLTITNAQLADSGGYSVVIFNGGGAVVSAPATVTVRSLPRITFPPISQTNLPGSTIVFNVGVAATEPITYQWHFNGQNIPGATSNSLSISNIDLWTHAGFYDVTVVDAVGTVQSQPAVLNVQIRPVITSPPVSNSVVQGGTAVFRVVAGPIHPLLPLTYRWVSTAGTPANNSNSVLVISNVQASSQIRLNVSSPAGQTNITSGVGLTMLPDFDHDGMADVWEVAHGFNTNNVADGAIDSDGDGMSNRDEYVAGTDPHDPTSVLQVAFVSGSLLQFTAQSNVSYTIQYRTNLNTAEWQTWSNVPPQSSPSYLVPFKAETNDLRFYRIMTPQWP